MRKIISVTFLLMIFGSASAIADVYTWRDAHGKVHYGDKPEAVGAERVAVESRPTDRAQVQARYETRQKNIVDSSAKYRTDKADEKAAAAAKKLSEEEQAAACTKARDRLKSYINARRLYRRDENGEPVYLESSEIDTARAEAQSEVADKCR